MGEVLADAAAQRERHRRRRRGRGCADLVDEVGLDPPHQIDRGVEHRAAAAKSSRRHRRGFPDRARPAGSGTGSARASSATGRSRRRRRRGLLPWRRGAGVGHRVALDRDPGRDPHAERVVRLIELDPGHPVAEEIVAFAPPDRRGLDVERSGMHALSGTIDRREPQHVARIGDRRRVVVGRGLPDIVDHPSASQRNFRPLVGREVGRRDHVGELHQRLFRPQEGRGVERGGVGGTELRRERGRDLFGRRQAAVVAALAAGRRDGSRCGPS